MSGSSLLKIQHHYEAIWHAHADQAVFPPTSVEGLPGSFRILVFAPTQFRKNWVYATCGMSEGLKSPQIELHMFSKNESLEIPELLAAVAHYHRTGSRLWLGHTVFFGRPWIANAKAEYGLVSLPYVDGPQLETLRVGRSTLVKCFWLIPITLAEKNFKAKFGLEELEKRFDSTAIDYADASRSSVC